MIRITSVSSFVPRVLSFVSIVLLAPSVHAAPVTWTLYGVEFEDGGVAEGTFDYDADTNLLIAWNISVSGGDEGVYPPLTYSFLTAGQIAEVDNGSSPADGQAFIFWGEPPQPGVPQANERQLRLDPDGVLTNAGGTFALDLGNPDRNIECFNCSPNRLITGGFVSTVPVPEPAASVLALTGLFGAIALRTRGRR
jgi:hypothetical protein